MTVYVIPCAGLAERWDDATPKQLAVVDGEPIVWRTVRQIRAHDRTGTIYIVVRPDMVGEAWRPDGVRGVRVTTARLDARRLQADKVLSSAHLWNRTGRTVVLFGDVWFSDAAVAAIVADRRAWFACARFGPSTVTGNDHAELFGFSFVPYEADTVRRAALRCVRLADRGLLVDWSGGWQIFAAMLGLPDGDVCAVDRVGQLGTFGAEWALSIDDETDDVDTSADLERLRAVVES